MKTLILYLEIQFITELFWVKYTSHLSIVVIHNIKGL